MITNRKTILDTPTSTPDEKAVLDIITSHKALITIVFDIDFDFVVVNKEEVTEEAKNTNTHCCIM